MNKLFGVNPNSFPNKLDFIMAALLLSVIGFLYWDLQGSSEEVQATVIHAFFREAAVGFVAVITLFTLGFSAKATAKKLKTKEFLAGYFLLPLGSIVALAALLVGSQLGGMHPLTGVLLLAALVLIVLGVVAFGYNAGISELPQPSTKNNENHVGG